MTHTADSISPAFCESKPVALSSIFRVFFLAGLMSFGGGSMAWVYREVVGRRGWLRDEDYLAKLALSQMLPGAYVANLCVLIGQYLRGSLGAFVSVVGLLTAPFFLIIGFARIYGQVIGLDGVHSAFQGVAAVAVGLIFQSGYRGGKRALSNAVPAFALLTTFLAVGVLNWPLVPVVLVVAPLSVGATLKQRRRNA